jgi:phosphoribosylglycinamide formyltransferase-1
VIATKSVPLQPGDTVEALEARVRAAEPPFFVETLRRITEGDTELPAITQNFR